MPKFAEEIEPEVRELGFAIARDKEEFEEIVTELKEKQRELQAQIKEIKNYL